jgi:glutaredoxin 2
LDVEAAEEDVAAQKEEIEALKEELKEETDAIVERWERAVEALEDVVITPRRADVDLALFALAWAPYWFFRYRSGNVVQTQTVPAF